MPHVNNRKMKNSNIFQSDNSFKIQFWDPPSARQNAKETSNKISDNMSAKDNKDALSSTSCNNNKNPKETQDMMPIDHNRFDEEYRKSSFDNNDKDKTQESVHEDKQKQDEHRIKTVRWLDMAEKSLMDLGISEDDRSKRLESLMERRRSKKLSSFQVRKTGMGSGIGNTSCGQIPSLNIPKKNPFLATDSTSDPNSSSPVSAPSYMVKSNPFDLPYDPHEEKPILTGDAFEHDSKPSRLGNFAPPEFTNYKYRTSFKSDFSIKQLPSGKLVTSTVANKEDDEKQPQHNASNPNHGTNNKHVKAEENKEADTKQPQQDASNPNDKRSSEKAVDIPDEANRIEKNTKEKETEHGISIDDDKSSSSSSSSSSCSEDERIRRPNKEAILHCLSMSRMRVVSEGKSFHRHAETFDCGPSSLFDKSKSDCFLFGGNRRIHCASMNSIASDMQVEVSEVGSPASRSSHERLNSFDTDLNEVRLSDVDDFSDESSVDSGFSRTDHDSEEKNGSYTTIEERCTFEKL